MSMRRMAALQAGVLLAAVFASAASKTNLMRIKVLDSETRSVSLGGNDVPKNCDQVNFDAYCNNSRAAVLTNTLLVQEDNGQPFRISCTIDSRFSRCAPLPKGESFDARKRSTALSCTTWMTRARCESSYTRWLRRTKRPVRMWLRLQLQLSQFGPQLPRGRVLPCPRHHRPLLRRKFLRRKSWRK